MARSRPFAAGLALAATMATQAVAQTPMGPDAFEAYVTGKTLIYGRSGSPYGIEEYGPGRSVRWAFFGEECLDGEWFPRGDAICFAYDAADGAQCWYFYREDDGLSAVTTDAPDATPLYEISQSPDPMPCAGPDVGV